MGRTTTIVLARTEARFRARDENELSGDETVSKVEISADEEQLFKTNEQYLDSIVCTSTSEADAKCIPFPFDIEAQLQGMAFVQNITTFRVLIKYVDAVRYMLYMLLHLLNIPDATERLRTFDQFKHEMSAKAPPGPIPDPPTQYRTLSEFEGALKDRVGTVIKPPLDTEEYNRFRNLILQQLFLRVETLSWTNTEKRQFRKNMKKYMKQFFEEPNIGTSRPSRCNITRHFVSEILRNEEIPTEENPSKILAMRVDTKVGGQRYIQFFISENAEKISEFQNDPESLKNGMNSALENLRETGTFSELSRTRNSMMYLVKTSASDQQTVAYFEFDEHCTGATLANQISQIL